jgi:hypothetical protein
LTAREEPVALLNSALLFTEKLTVPCPELGSSKLSEEQEAASKPMLAMQQYINGFIYIRILLYKFIIFLLFNLLVYI